MAITGATRGLVRDRAGRRCEYCHADECWQFVRFTVDHIVPTSVGGTDDPSNLALACRNCNERRGNRERGVDPESGSIVALFDPRRDTWAEHFIWTHGGLRIAGTTPHGRATMDILDLNDDRHGQAVIRVRERDVRDGLHPPADDPVEE